MPHFLFLGALRMEKISQMSMFGYDDKQKSRRMVGEVLEISPTIATEFLLPRHYSGRIPNICKAYGWYVKGNLQAVCTFGKPASNSLCVGLCGEEYADRVYELNRLCREKDFHEPLSSFVSACLRRLRTMRWIIVSYSDTAMNHHGYIYQACNFLYTGETKERTDIYTGGGGRKHARHYTKEDRECGIRKVRSAKHRYVYFCTHTKYEKNLWKSALRYEILPYPKGDNNPDYELGDYIEPILVNQ